jgi:hypothetical protein
MQETEDIAAGAANEQEVGALELEVSVRGRMGTKVFKAT